MLPVIETYEELGAVVAILVAIVLAIRFVWRRHRKSGGGVAEGSPRSCGVSQYPRLPAIGPIDFDKLAQLIDDATGRAEHIVKNQSAAALKLDTAEIAINRLFAEIDGIVGVPRDVLVDAGVTPAAPVRLQSSKAA